MNTAFRMDTSMEKNKLEIVGMDWETLKGISHTHSVRMSAGFG